MSYSLLRCKHAYVFSALIFASNFANAELKELDDKALDDQKGQAGLTIDIEFEMSIGEIAWKFGDDKASKFRKNQKYNFEDPPRIEYVLPEGK